MHTTSDLSLDVPSVTKTAPPWSAAKAMLLSWAYPKTAAMRTNHVSLKAALAVHILSALGVLLLVSLLVGLETSLNRTGAITAAGSWHRTVDFWEDAVREFQKRPKLWSIIVAAFVGAVELGYVALAVIFAAWGARDEPTRASLRHALRHTWLHTLHAGPAILLVTAIFLPFESARHAWYAGYQSKHPYPSMTVASPPSGTPPESPLWRAYAQARQQDELARQEYYREFDEFYRLRLATRPWYVLLYDQQGEELIAASILLAVAWALWSLLRGLAAPRQTAAVERPPMCERCGYDLTGQAMESRCPECGERVVDSLGPDARRGVPWERAAEFGRWRAWRRCAVDPLVRPAKFGRQISLSSPATAHRRFLLMHLIGISVAVPLGFVLWFGGRRPLFKDGLIAGFVLDGILGGWGVALAALVITNLVCVAVSLIQGRRSHRNLMSGAVQFAGYMSGYALVWAVIAMTWGAAVLSLPGPFMKLEGAAGVDYEVLMVIVWAIPNAILAAIYLNSLWHGTAAMRSANR